MDTTELETWTNTIAAQLGETGPVALEQIKRALQTCGPEFVQALAQEALTAEAQEKLLRCDGQRRTRGGVFFRLLRDRASQQQRRQLWPKAKREKSGLPWAERADAVQLALGRLGEVMAMRLTVIGRPKDVKPRDSFVIVTIEDGGAKLPPLPRGLPTPSSTTSVCKVCLVEKHWRKVSAALKDPTDVLIAEGYAYDKTGCIIILATQATTKKQQIALRAAQKEAVQ